MIYLILFAKMCGTPELTTISKDVKLTKRDRVKFEYLKKHHKCGLYYKDATCLKKVIKVEKGVYRAICGERS